MRRAKRSLKHIRKRRGGGLRFLAPFALGRDHANVEDMWQTAYVSSYRRNGPVLNGALSIVKMSSSRKINDLHSF